MLYAEKVEFIARPAVMVGGMFNGYTIDRIEVSHDEYENHSEMLVVLFAQAKQIGKFWNYPCGVTYK